MKNPIFPAMVLLAAATFASAQEITRFRLMNADTDKPVAGFDPLENGAVIDLESLSTRNLNIEAVVGKGKVGSVRFSYDGDQDFKTESEAPFALAGDRNGDFGGWTPDAGKRSLSAIAFSGAKGQGTKGEVRSVEFTVVDGAKASVAGGKWRLQHPLL